MRTFPLDKISLAALLALALCAGACADDEVTAPRFTPPAEVGVSGAYGIWAPSGTDTCSSAIHDSYSVVGPDGLRYPTWHPPVHPATGCTFGHEHGRDPAGSDLYREVGPIPFGYANQHLVESGFGAPRNEDHFGHKVEWANDMPMRVGETGNATFDVRCDVLTKLHQGTHSPDAFTNNLHEVVYHVRCSDGTAFSATLLTPIGTPGELVANCERERRTMAGTANPTISPAGGGVRLLPDAGCIDEHVIREDGERPRFDAALHESWEINGSLRRPDGRVLASFDPYYQVRDPSRYYDPASTDRAMSRPIDLCYLPVVALRDRCQGLPAEPIAWDDARSPFKGVRRFVDVNGNRVRNADGPEVWYTDPLGRNARTSPFPGSIRQWIAKHDNSGLDLHGEVMGHDRSYDAPGVRAPN